MIYSGIMTCTVDLRCFRVHYRSVLALKAGSILFGVFFILVCSGHFGVFFILDPWFYSMLQSPIYFSLAYDESAATKRALRDRGCGTEPCATYD